MPTEHLPFVKGDDGKDYIRLYYFMPAKHLYNVLAEDRMKVSVPERCNDPLEFLPAKDDENQTPTREEGGFISFSSVDDNPLMWAHYADAHKGVCLQFDFPVQDRGELSDDFAPFFADEESPDGEKRNQYVLIDLPTGDRDEPRQYWYIGKSSEKDKNGPFYATLVEVAYAAKRPKRKLGMGGAFFMDGVLQDLKISKVFFSKSLEWSYEREWRLMVTLGGCKEYREDSFFVSGLTRYISAIILGARYPVSRRTTAAAVIQAMKNSPLKGTAQPLYIEEIYRAIFADDEYRMTRSRCELPSLM